MKLNYFLLMILFSVISFHSLSFGKALTDVHWREIAIAIANAADANDRGEFEQAKQAFLNIKEDRPAKAAAKVIQTQFKNSTDNDVRTESGETNLLGLTRYPAMEGQPAKIKTATEELFHKPNISQFIKSQDLDVVDANTKASIL